MIGTIRKHSKLLWGIIIPVLIISLFVFFLPQSRNGGGGGSAAGDLGSINGKKITPQQFAQGLNEFKFLYFFQHLSWPDKSAGISQSEMEQVAYQRLFLNQKAADLGIHAGMEATAAAANQMLRSLARSGQTITLNDFVTQVLQPEGLTAADFEDFARSDVVIQQLVQSIGSSGALVTPQEAAGIYEREHKEITAQIVFFSADKYLSSVVVTPDALGKFYTNYLAEYRLPDRVQINYVAFELTNFMAQSKAEWAKTNFDAQVEAIFAKYGMQGFAAAKTPDDAKAEIRDSLVRQRAFADARVQANELAGEVFKVDPARAENLATVAKQKGLVVRTTAPFDVESGPQEFSAPEGFAKTAFGLTPDEPFANPLASTNGIYVIALARQLPSEIPSFAAIRARVTEDYRMQQAIGLAREAGTNLYVKLTVGMAVGKTFAAVCAADGLQPQTLPPFSLSTRQLPALGQHAELNQVKQAAFTTTVGHASNFHETSDGGFILNVQKQLPVDPAATGADLPQFTDSLRRARENEAFQQWLQVEAGRALRDTPIARRPAAQ